MFAATDSVRQTISGLRVSRGVAAATLLSGVALLLGGCAVKPEGGCPNRPVGEVTPSCWPMGESGVARDPAIEERIVELLADMSDEDKVAQLIQGDIGSLTPQDVGEYRLGSVLNGGNSGPGGDVRAEPQAWLDLADAMWDASVGPDGDGIPAIWGTDAVHGHNNLVGATIFPHNIGLGAANDPELIRRIGAVTAREVAVTGLDWTFAPTVAVPRDDRWGRTYEGYSEAPDIVAAYAYQMVLGVQGEPGTEEFLGPDKVVANAKHFLGDGGTHLGVDQGDTLASQTDLRDLHAAGYPTAIAAGLQVAMASFNSWHGRKLHGHEELLTDVLVDRMGFDGFVVGDWNGHGQVAGCKATSCPQSLMAGVDMFMAPDSWRELYHNTLTQVQDGTVSRERLDEAVGRILRVKLQAGLFDKGRPSSRPLAGRFELLGAPEHRAVAREAVRKSLVLLKNQNDALPIRGDAFVLVAGDGAQNIGKQTGGWTLSWQGDGNSREHFPNAQSIFEGLEETLTQLGGRAELSEDGSWTDKPDVAVVVFGEDPYAEFRGDRTNVDFTPPNDTPLQMLKAFQEAGIPTVSVFLSGRPLWVNPELNASDAFVAAWLPGSEGGGIADVIVGDADATPRNSFSGKLSFSWPNRPDQTPLNVGDEDYDPLFAYGFGLTYEDDGALDDLPVDYAVAAERGGDIVVVGNATTGWSMIVSEAGETPAPLEGPRGASEPNGALSWSRTDRAAQEDALTLTWTGSDAAKAAVTGEPIDWVRESNGDVTLLLAYRVESQPEEPVSLSMTCGKECGGSVDISGVLADAPAGEWGEMVIPLTCFANAGTDMSSIDGPFVLSTSGPFAISLSNVGLEAGLPEFECPS